MNLKQKAFFFVAVNAAVLLLVYLFFTNYYVREQEKQLRNRLTGGEIKVLNLFDPAA